MPRASNLVIFLFSTCFSHFCHFFLVIAHNFTKSRSRDGLAVKGVFPDDPPRPFLFGTLLCMWYDIKVEIKACTGTSEIEYMYRESKVITYIWPAL